MFLSFKKKQKQIADDQYEVDTMTRVGENRFYVPSIRFPGEMVWYYHQDIRDVIPEPLPATSSATHFCILPDVWEKHKNVGSQWSLTANSERAFIYFKMYIYLCLSLSVFF